MSTFIAISDWAAPPERIEIRPHELHVVRTIAGVAVPRLERLASILSVEEHARVTRLARAESRRQFIVGRSVLRRVLGRCLDVAPHAVRIVHSAAGKPALAPGGADLRFSLSHAGDLVLLALARTLDVGVDAERMRDDLPLDRIADRVLDEQVKAVLNAQAAEARTLAFFHAWTQREAIVKAVGGRLFTTADPLAFHWPRPSRAVLRARGDGEASALAPLWTVIVPPLDGAHVATAVVAGEIERVQLWSLTP